MCLTRCHGKRILSAITEEGNQMPKEELAAKTKDGRPRMRRAKTSMSLDRELIRAIKHYQADHPGTSMADVVEEATRLFLARK